MDQDSVEALVKAERVHYLMAALVDVIPGMDASLPLIESVVTSLNGIASWIADYAPVNYMPYLPQLGIREAWLGI